MYPEWFETQAAEIAHRNPRYDLEEWADLHAEAGLHLEAALCSRALEIQAARRDKRRGDQRASRIARFIARTFSSGERLMIFPGSHENLRESARVIAWEGGDAPYDWPVYVAASQTGRDLADQLGVFLEPIHGCALGVYPADLT